MLKMRSTRTVELIGVALILAAVLAMAAYFAIVPMPHPSIPAVNFVAQNGAPASIASNPATARSVYVSEQTLRRMLDDAYERHQTTRVQTLLHILNGRYERRSGLPW